MDAATENYVLLLLADSNLPTGAFVASAGLESYITHGFFASSPAAPRTSTAAADNTLRFLRASLDAYARAALPFVADAHAAVDACLRDDADADDACSVDAALAALLAHDALYEAMTLSDVARRASRTQGVALLTLYTRGFAAPPGTPDLPRSAVRAGALVDRLKAAVRGERTPGHLPICWALLARALGLSAGARPLGFALSPALTARAERAAHLHLFLHARGMLSAAVRLNTLGPYAAQQLLLHSVRPIVDDAAARCAQLHTGLLVQDDADPVFDEIKDGPATTWPLGEIIIARHDLQHTRIFNS
jgi:urease accessory protein